MDKKELFSQPISNVNFDPTFEAEVIAHEEAKDLKACFNCGACTAGCPIHEVFPEYDPKKLAKMVRLGMRKEVLSSPYIWYCATCHNCEQRCPQNVKFFNVLNVLKNMAAKEGYAPSVWVDQIKHVIKTGIIFPPQESWIKRREKLSLPPLRLEEREEIKKIIELEEIDRLSKDKSE